MKDDKTFKVVATDPSNYKPKDKRLCKPIGYREKKTNEVVLIQPLECAKVERKRVSYLRPNNVALSLSIYDTHIREANRLYQKRILPHLRKCKGDFSDDAVPELCDYFEHLQTALVFSYTAVEAFANLSIPRNYKYKKSTSRGTVEIYDKKNIERWLSLSEKVKNILPKVLKISPPTSQPFWQDFLKLENLRKSIIHQKTIEEMDVYSEFLKPSIFNSISSGVAVLKYYYNSNPSNMLWPWGLGAPVYMIWDVDEFPLKHANE